MDALSSWSPRVLSVLRLVAGLLFLEHGLQKVVGFPPAAHMPMPVTLTLGGVSGLFELVGGALLALGLFTRPVAFILSGEMAVAYFTVHAPKGFYPINNMGEPAIVYCFLFLYFFFAGPGPWSVDALIGKRP